MAHLQKDANGHLIKATDGHLVNFCGVARPCVDCREAQPSAVVTIAGPDCQDVAGTYAWGDLGLGPPGCSWVWDQIAGLHILVVIAQPGALIFDEVYIDEFSGSATHFRNGSPTELDCVDGSVGGTILLDGVGLCAAMVATVTFG